MPTLTPKLIRTFDTFIVETGVDFRGVLGQRVARDFL